MDYITLKSRGISEEVGELHAFGKVPVMKEAPYLNRLILYGERY